LRCAHNPGLKAWATEKDTAVDRWAVSEFRKFLTWHLKPDYPPKVIIFCGLGATAPPHSARPAHWGAGRLFSGV
jgi:hypothetical protein